MGYSNVELANQALDHLGKERIASLSEDSTAARKINEVFERTIHSALARSHWSFARKFRTLSSVTNDWDERWTYKYDKPNDAITVVRLVPRVDAPNERGPAFQMHGSSIYTDENEAKAEYVYETTDTLNMPQPFLDAVAYLLARNVAMPLTRKQSLRDSMNAFYELALGAAIEQDAGQEFTALPEGDQGYIDARGGTSETVEGAAPDGSIYWS